MIEVKDIVKSFDGNVVLNHVSTEMRDGEVNMIIGQSGSGKTVLMKSLIGLHSLDSGQILYDGTDIAEMKSKDIRLLHRQVGMLFQGSALFDSMTVMENVLFPMEMFSPKSREEMKARAEFCLRRVELPERVWNLMPSEISGGQQKRVAIARALITQPKIILADEPTGALDSKTSVEVMQLLTKLNREEGKTIIVVTHESGVANQTDKIVHIKDGIIGEIEENKDHKASPFGINGLMK